MKITYTTETYLIKEITKQTPATKAVKPNDLVQFVAYKDRNDYGGNFVQFFRLVVNGKKTKHILTESKMIDFLSYHTESISIESIDLETFELKDKVEVPLKDEFVNVETFVKKLKWNKSDLKTLLELQERKFLLVLHKLGNLLEMKLHQVILLLELVNLNKWN